MSARYKSTPWACGTCRTPLKFRVRTGLRVDAVYVHADTLRYRCNGRLFRGSHSSSAGLLHRDEAQPAHVVSYDSGGSSVVKGVRVKNVSASERVLDAVETTDE